MPAKGIKRLKVPCPDCGKEVGSVASHRPFCTGRVAELELAAVEQGGGVAVMERPEPGKPRSRRGRERYAGRQLTTLEQIPVMPGNDEHQVTGAWCYFLRPEGATIGETLILQPNGGIPEINNPRQRQRFGSNSDYYQNLAEMKGYEYIGQKLTTQAVRRLVGVLAQNREDEVLFCEDEIVNARHAADNSDLPEIRERQRKRAAQFETRLEYLNQPINVDALVQELDEIAHAQALAKVDPNVLRVMREMIGEVNEKLAKNIAHFQNGLAKGGEGGPRLSRGSGADPSDFDKGAVDHYDE